MKKNYIKKSVRILQSYVPGEQPKDLQIVKLNTNENPYPPSPRVRKVLAAFQPEALQRYPDPLSLDLRRAIAKLHACAPEQVFIGNGSDEILALCTRAFVEDQGSIGYFEPSYSLYPVLAAIRDVAVRPLALGPRFEWRMPASYQCSLFFLTNPNAPTGARYPKDKVRAFCRRMRGVIVLDEAYVDFADGDCLDLALASEHVLVLRSFSKSYSLAGLRAGYAIGSAALIEALLKIKDSYNTSRLTQAIALAAVRDQRTLRANVQRIRRTRGWLAAQLAALGFEVFPSETNFLWVRPPRLPALELFQQLVARRIFVRHFPGRRTAAYLRITVGTDQQAQLLMQALREVYGAP